MFMNVFGLNILILEEKQNNMPIPKPTKEEEMKDFIDRCMSNKTMVNDFPDESQRYSVCIAQIGAQVLNEETYNDYPKSASENAKRALKYRDESGNPKGCGTQVGWTRANQLANNEKISRETIARMSSFSRHRQNKDVPYDEGCGGLMWDAWGGDEGIAWAERKLEQIDNQNKKVNLIKISIILQQSLEEIVDFKNKNSNKTE
jgi:hypothetical protein